MIANVQKRYTSDWFQILNDPVLDQLICCGQQDNSD